jgi:hypothetical protein
LRESLKDIAEKITAKTTKPRLPPREDGHEIGKLIRYDMAHHVQSGDEFCRFASARRGVTLANFFSGEVKLRGSRQKLVFEYCRITQLGEMGIAWRDVLSPKMWILRSNQCGFSRLHFRKQSVRVMQVQSAADASKLFDILRLIHPPRFKRTQLFFFRCHEHLDCSLRAYCT